ncbi:NAD(P)/FAD-dependent oxidoreductase [Streptomyces sp. AJS327]|uniref:flavin-containing monooxygenase n=1 Tax=Streptomyces sp. AJS327 TaxID=2545265 RepID=UPI0015DE060C|nr:NAD(P)/FAD-dependent oxidoreductase [Streptomyces sp. AJS327]MBA0050902.1 NAD(P)/FAD-dependent oxidoreductase [Streptomyces sp. AJS327]
MAIARGTADDAEYVTRQTGVGSSGGPVDVRRLDRALEDANIPTLISVLAHLTGEERWLRRPFRPTRTKGLSEHADGGLDGGTQATVRRAVRDLLVRTPRPAPAPLSDERLAAIMSNCMGEEVPLQYAGLMREEMGLEPRFDPERLRRCERRDDYSVTIVGAGASGLCMAIQLKLAGIAFTVLEKNPDLGGTWFENRYPDCGVDTPSYWYSYSFNPGNWARYYSKRDDVHAYFRETAERFGILEHIEFDTKVDRAEWNPESATWTIQASRGDGTRSTHRSSFVISAVGQLNMPKTPEIPGAPTFTGRQFHSARWPHDLDLRGKRVAVIGTGASAMQLVPAIRDEVAHLTIFQRSPQWVARNTEYTREVSDSTRYLMEHVPHYAAWYRMRQVWAFGDKIFQSLVVDPAWAGTSDAINSVNEGYRSYFTKYMREQLAGHPDLQHKAIPSYPPFGKRMLLDNGWFDTLKAPHVELVTDRITGIEPGGVVTGETVHEADVIVYATGFEALNLLGSLEVEGRDGATLRDRWGDDDARAFLGMTERGFPNLFFLYGPNTNLGHGGSLLFIAECQARYILDLLAQVIDEGTRAVECRQDLRDQYNRDIDRAHEALIWTHPGMSTWYRNNRGRVVTNSPWRLLDLWEMTRHADLSEYDTDTFGGGPGRESA